MEDRDHERSSGRTRKLKRFGTSQDGMSALEFALISPVLLFLLCAAVDIGRALTASNRATYLADGLAELISRVPDKTTLTPAALNGFIEAAPLLNPEILHYAKQSGTTQYQNKVDITITSIQYTQTVPACKTNCEYEANVVFSHVNSSPTARQRECGKMIPVSDSASYSPKVLAISSYGPVNLIVIDVGVYYKPLFHYLYSGDRVYNRTAYFRPRNVSRIDSTVNCPGFIPNT